MPQAIHHEVEQPSGLPALGRLPGGEDDAGQADEDDAAIKRAVTEIACAHVAPANEPQTNWRSEAVYD